METSTIHQADLKDEQKRPCCPPVAWVNLMFPLVLIVTHYILPGEAERVFIHARRRKQVRQHLPIWQKKLFWCKIWGKPSQSMQSAPQLSSVEPDGNTDDGVHDQIRFYIDAPFWKSWHSVLNWMRSLLSAYRLMRVLCWQNAIVMEFLRLIWPGKPQSAITLKQTDNKW